VSLQTCIIILASGQWCSATFTLALACNRFIQIVFENYIDILFSQSKTKVIVDQILFQRVFIDNHCCLLADRCTGVCINVHTESDQSYISTILDVGNIFAIHNPRICRCVHIARNLSIFHLWIIVNTLRYLHRFYGDSGLLFVWFKCEKLFIFTIKHRHFCYQPSYLAWSSISSRNASYSADRNCMHSDCYHTDWQTIGWNFIAIAHCFHNFSIDRNCTGSHQSVHLSHF